jgi:hypothetical protein
VSSKREIDRARRATCPDCGYVYDGGPHALGMCPRCLESDAASGSPPSWVVRMRRLLHMPSVSKSIH